MILYLDITGTCKKKVHSTNRSLFIIFIFILGQVSLLYDLLVGFDSHKAQTEQDIL